MHDLKTKTVAKLVSYGNNIDDVKKMIEIHFDFALKCGYKTPATLAKFIRTIY